jgi:hypothetical protein
MPRVDDMTPIDRAKHYYLLYKEYEAEASRYKLIAQNCYREAHSKGQTVSSDGTFEILVSNADGVAVIPDRDIFAQNHPHDMDELYKIQKESVKLDISRTAIEKYARDTKNLKGRAVEEYVRSCSVIVPTDPSFRARTRVSVVKE